MVKHTPRGRFEDPVVRLIVRAHNDDPKNNVFITETRQVPEVGDRFGFGNGPLYRVVRRCWCPLGDQGERPWVVYLTIEPDD